MMCEQKRKIRRGVVVVLGVAVLLVTAVLLMLMDMKYTDFRTMQFEPVDLRLFGIEPATGSGLYSAATWIGEGYACTVEQNGKTGECISVPYVEWVMSDTRADTNGGVGQLRFLVAERTMLGGKIRTGKSPYRYSNVVLTLIVGDQTEISGCQVLGNMSDSISTVDDGDKVTLDVAVLDNGLRLSADEAEMRMDQAWQEQKFTLNRTVFSTDGAQGVQIHLPEKWSVKKPSYHLGGRNPAGQAVLGINCDMEYINRLGSLEKEFPQTAYFKVTYDVENTVTGTRTTHSTGWISQKYTAHGL